MKKNRLPKLSSACCRSRYQEDRPSNYNLLILYVICLPLTRAIVEAILLATFPSSTRSHRFMSESIFDHTAFNARVFHPREDEGSAPPGAEDLIIPVEHDIRLHVRVYPAPSAQRAVLLFHGNGELVADYDFVAHHYLRMNTTLAVVDYRGYGRSEGDPRFRTMIEDAPKVVEAFQPVLSRETRLPLVVLGRSLGSACAAEIAKRSPDGVVGLVFDSAFSNLKAFALRRGRQYDVPLSEQDYEAFCPLRKLASCHLPILIMHGAQDTLLAPTEAQTLFDATASARKRIVFIEEYGHNDLFYAPAYWQNLTSFLEEIAS